MKCENCNSEVFGNVCKNCGFVLNDHPIDYSSKKKIMNQQLAEREFAKEFATPLMPDIRFMRKNSKYYDKSTKEYKYIIAYTNINKICSAMKLDCNVRREALTLYKEVRKKFPDLFKSYHSVPCYLAFIKIGCEINSRPIDFNELKSYTDHPKNVNKAIYDIKLKLKLKIEQNMGKYIDKIGFDLNLDYQDIVKVHNDYKILKKNLVGNRQNHILALYHLTLGISKTKIANISKVARQTIINNIKNIKRVIK